LNEPRAELLDYDLNRRVVPALRLHPEPENPSTLTVNENSNLSHTFKSDFATLRTLLPFSTFGDPPRTPQKDESDLVGGLSNSSGSTSPFFSPYYHDPSASPRTKILGYVGSVHIFSSQFVLLFFSKMKHRDKEFIGLIQ
jgi:hypothetical protein